MLPRVPVWSALLLALPSALLASLIVLPAPIYLLFEAAVGAAEWSVWLFAVGIVAMFMAVGSLRSSGGLLAALAVALSLVTIVCSLLPIVTSWEIARQRHIQLSWQRYVFGWAAARSIIEERDVPYTVAGDQTLRLDVYRPDTADQTLPAVVVIHGGSWRNGAKGDYVTFNRWLAMGGKVVFDVDYRLAMEGSRFPAQIADVKCAIGWVRQHAQQYHVDPTRVALLGRSAGGQLALLAAYSAGDAALKPSCDVSDAPVKAVISFYGPTDLVWGYYHPAHPDVLDGPGVLRNYLNGPPEAVPAAYALAAPVEHVGPGSPPTLFIHGGHDQLVSHVHVDRILPRLQAANIPRNYLYLPWANHGFDFNGNGWGSQLAQAEIAAFFQTYL